MVALKNYDVKRRKESNDIPKFALKKLVSHQEKSSASCFDDNESSTAGQPNLQELEDLKTKYSKIQKEEIKLRRQLEIYQEKYKWKSLFRLRQIYFVGLGSQI